MKSNRVLIIIPAYNEAANIEPVINSLAESDYDYVVINDGSTDGTGEICQKTGANTISLPINLGIGGAVQTGYKYALIHDYNIAVQLDGDGQHDAKFIPELVAPILNGEADYVIGSRYMKEGGFKSTRMRRLGIQIISGVIYMFTKTRILDATSGFRAVSRGLIELFALSYAQDYPEPEAIIQAAAAGFHRVMEIPVEMRERAGGKSSIGLWRSVYYIVKVCMSIMLNRIIHNGGNDK